MRTLGQTYGGGLKAADLEWRNKNGGPGVADLVMDLGWRAYGGGRFSGGPRVGPIVAVLQ